MSRWLRNALAWGCLVGTTFAVADEPRAITAQDRGHWAFVPPRRHLVPPIVTNGATIRNPIDAFVWARLEEEGLSFAPEAERSTLLRRLCFDLTGLPPTPEQRAEFLADSAPDAYEKLVDRLLASPHYGERWAQHWLDLARYADTDGFEFDQARPNAWRYRDWVVDALNRDLPYDAFIRLQLAGDEVTPEDPSGFIATGFNRCYPDMVDLNDQGLRRQNALNDITETTGLVFLGLTIGCARCHDHKFDPIRQTDFFQLQAFFTPARFRDDYPIATPRGRAEYERRLDEWEGRVAGLQAVLIALEAPIRAAVAPGEPPGATDATIAAIQKAAAERSRTDVRLVFEARVKDRRIGADLWPVVLGPLTALARRALLGRIDQARLDAPAPLPAARGLDETGRAVPPTFLLKRGEYGANGPEVFPAVPAVLVPGAARPLATVPLAHSSGRRKALADWLTRPDQPLTARVLVNRLWERHFGRGLVATPSDFGTMGAEPSHPELLDWLAVEFVSRGWGLKALHRLMVTSATYRQSSRSNPAGRAADPDNTLLWRHGRQRLDGEALRDALLAVSGRLNPALGGPSVFPELPAELTKLSNKGAVWPVSPGPEDRNRRSLYVFVRRNFRYPFFEAFDRPDTNASCPRRTVSTIAPQALTLLNSRLANDAAVAFADRVIREAGPRPLDQIRRASLLAVGREPDAVEQRLAREFLEGGGPLRSYCLALLNANEFLYLD